MAIFDDVAHEEFERDTPESVWSVSLDPPSMSAAPPSHELRRLNSGKSEKRESIRKALCVFYCMGYLLYCAFVDFPDCVVIVIVAAVFFVIGPTISFKMCTPQFGCFNFFSACPLLR